MTVVWLKHTLRLHDNPALFAAAQKGPILPVFIYDSSPQTSRSLGGASRWWLHQSLKSLQQSLQDLGCSLIFFKGEPREILSNLALAHPGSSFYWNQSLEPQESQKDQEIEQHLTRLGASVQIFPGDLLLNPETFLNQQKQPFRVFTPFWKEGLKRLRLSPPLSLPPLRPAALPSLSSLSLEDLNLLPPGPSWYRKLETYWTPGEGKALEKLHCFIEEKLPFYLGQRDLPFKEITSLLSPHLHFGEIGPRQVFYTLEKHKTVGGDVLNADGFIRQLCWREFSSHLLHHFPSFPDQPFNEKFQNFPWLFNEAHLKAWKEGKTGYPLVDAGMRELWETGYMHNRVRMVVASFLTKHLLIPWQEGEKWFWDTLVDADLANNSVSWQWVAGCGVDAAPYFRIFNPILQSEKFDPQGKYIQKWIPELRSLSGPALHRPWTSPGHAYPKPLIEHEAARKRALLAYQSLK